MGREKTADAIVVGLGIMGAAAAYALARDGAKTIAFEQFDALHDLGSSHGESRMLRLCYSEGAAYVPLLREAIAEFRRLEHECGQELLVESGGLYLAPPESPIVRGAIDAAEATGLSYEVLSAQETMRRFPMFSVPREVVGLHDPGASTIRAARAWRAYLDGAAARGATLRVGEAVQRIEPRNGHVLVATSRGVYEAKTVVLTCGPWISKLAPFSPDDVWPTRQHLVWCLPGDLGAVAKLLPAWRFQDADGARIYGLPMIDERLGVKIGGHDAGEPIVPRPAKDEPDVAIVDRLRAALKRLLPGIDADRSRAATCRYTNTRDGRFMLGRLARDRRVIVAAAFNGQGFKFAPVVGDRVSRLVRGEDLDPALASFAPDRWSAR